MNNNRIYYALEELGITNANAAQVNIIWALLRKCQTEQCSLREAEKTERERRKVYDDKLCKLRTQIEALLVEPPGRRKLLRKLQRYLDSSTPISDFSTHW